MYKALEDLTPQIQCGGASPLKYNVGRDYVPKQNAENKEFLASKNLKIMNFTAKKYENNE